MSAPLARVEVLHFRHALPEPVPTTMGPLTHRPAILRIVDRLIVVSNGRIAMDGPKDKVLAQLRGGEAAA